MTDKIYGFLLTGSAVLLYLAGVAAFIAMIQALTVSSTISAIESAFGTFVLTILLMALAKNTWDRGKKRLAGQVNSQ